MTSARSEAHPFFVEFEIGDTDRFAKLAEVFTALRAAKQSGEFGDDERWLRLFDEPERAYFWWPTEAEAADWGRRWFATPLPQRWTDPTLKTGWTFGSMIDAFKNGDYDLLDCRSVAPGIGRIEFDPHAWPYGGKECMKALIESFGFRVTDESGA